MAFIRELYPRRIRDHQRNLLLYRLRRIGERYIIIIALRHLSIVEAEELRRLRQYRFGLGEYAALIQRIEPPDYLARQFKVRDLVYPHGHAVCIVYGYVGGLKDRISQK